MDHCDATMSIEMPTDKPPSPATDERAGPVSVGWLQGLRARLGLPGPQSVREALEFALKEDPRDGAFSAEERSMLLRLLRFGASRVDDVMVPRADIVAVEEGEPLAELVRTFEEVGVSRIPLFHDTLDDPRGMIHIKDLFQWILAEVGLKPNTGSAVPEVDDKNSPQGAPPQMFNLANCDLSRPCTVAKIRRPVLYVPPSMPAMNLLIRMQSTRIHMALVVDEYGGTDGLVTIEDLVEQIVGDIEDEHDAAEAALISTDAKLGLVASARAPVKELEDRLGVELLNEIEREEIDTLGGLIFALLSRVPARGEIVRHPSGVEFEVLDADARRVKKLKIHLHREGGSRELATGPAPAAVADAKARG